MKEILEALFYSFIVCSTSIFILYIVTIPYSFKNKKLYSKIYKKIESEGYEFNKSLFKRIFRRIKIIFPVSNVDEYRLGERILNNREEFNNYIQRLLTDNQIFGTNEKQMPNYRERMQKEIYEFHRDSNKTIKDAEIENEESTIMSIENLKNLNYEQKTEKKAVEYKTPVPTTTDHHIKVKKLKK